jgi:hypothetical protein
MHTKLVQHLFAFQTVSETEFFPSMQERFSSYKKSHKLLSTLYSQMATERINQLFLNLNQTFFSLDYTWDPKEDNQWKTKS